MAMILCVFILPFFLQFCILYMRMLFTLLIKIFYDIQRISQIRSKFEKQFRIVFKEFYINLRESINN